MDLINIILFCIFGTTSVIVGLTTIIMVLGDERESRTKLGNKD